MKRITLIFSFVFIALINSAKAYDCSTYPSAKEIDVKVTALLSKDDDVFEYNYILTSSAISKQDVWEFLVEHFSPIADIKSPIGWGGGKEIRQPFLWSSDYSESNIKPNSFLNSFSFKSAGLPIIIAYYARGWYELPKVSESEAPDEPCPEQDILINAVKDNTIGPKDPPADFKPLDFLNSIINMKHEAFKLGWIKNEGILKSLDAKLENAKKDIEKGNTRSAKNTIKAFINEVEAQGCESYDNCPSGKHLTSEAYGLLKYNAQYLIDRL